MRKSIIAQLLVFVVIGLCLEGGFFYAYLRYDLNIFADKQAEKTRLATYEKEQYALKDMVQMAYSTAQKYYDVSQDMEALKQAKADQLKMIIEGVENQLKDFHAKNKDTLDQEALTDGMKEIVRSMRFDNGNYIWINDLEPRMIMHPIKSSLDGKSLANTADPKGKKLFVEMAKACKANGEGIVDYLWAKPEEDTPTLKVSYVKLIPELGWILGTGAWVEDITDELKAQALDQIGKMRMADGNYFWVNDLTPTMIMHPLKPELNGQDISRTKDKRGKVLFTEMAEKCRTNGEGFVDYYWAKPGESGDFPKLSFVKLFKPWGWIIGMGVYMDDVDNQILTEQQEFGSAMTSLLNRSLLIFAGILVAILTALLWFITHSLKTPLRKLVEFADAVSEGDLSATIQGVFKGEIFSLKHAIETMVGSLKEKMAEAEQSSAEAKEEAERAREATQEAEQARHLAERAKCDGMLSAANFLENIVNSISTASEELSMQAAEINAGAGEQKARISETATAMEEMNATILEVANSSSSAAENADTAMSQATDGQEIVQNSVQAIEEVQGIANVLKDNTAQLDAQVEAIGKIINVINDIADQTNLLALNAAIEAARAGEAGRGFAVVADEVRKLAEKTMTATKEVGDSISAIQKAATENNRSVDKAVHAIDQATELVNNSGESLAQILALSEQSADQVRNIATAAEEQSAASEEITHTIEDVDQLTERISQGMHESMQAQAELAEQTAKLKDLIDKIKEENSCVQ